MNATNCPYCGAEIQEQEVGNKIWYCRHCSHSLLLEAQPFIQPIQSTTDSSALLSLGSSFICRQQRYTTYGFLNFAHNEGIRTEWLVKDGSDDDYYLVADDENFFLLQSQAKQQSEIPNWESLQPNTHFNYSGKDWLVTEQRRMTLEDFSSNALPSDLKNSSRNDTYLIADNAETLMIMFNDDAMAFRQGFWLDPFEIEVCP